MHEEYAVTPSVDGLVDVLDRVIHCGAVVSGDVIISLAGIDLIRLDLRLLLCAIDTAFDPTMAATALEEAPL
jgi:Gas vesicle protein